MLIRGKTLKEVTDYFVNDGSFISLVLIKETDDGSVYRLKYHEERYCQRSWNNETFEETTWLVVDGDMVRSSHPMKRIAMARIGIVNERKIRKKVIRLIHVSGHFVSSVRGTITDFTYGRKMIIKGAWRISKKIK
jgi:hypothetical protein